MAAEFVGLSRIVYEGIANVGRLDRVESDSIQAIDLLKFFEQMNESIAIADIIPIAACVYARKSEFAITRCDHGAGLLNNLFAGATDALPPHAGDDAVGAVFVASILHLKHAAGASSVDQAINGEEGVGVRWSIRAKAQFSIAGLVRLQAVDKMGLFSVAHYQICTGSA